MGRVVYRPKLLIIAVLAVALGVATAFILQQSANAAIGTGLGSGSVSKNCDGGGIAGCPWTSNGHGWFEFPIDASTNIPTGNGIWGTAYNQCKAENAAQIIAYVIFTGDKPVPKWSTAWIYKYLDAYLTYQPYYGNISIAEARARYMTLPAAQRANYKFGYGGNFNIHKADDQTVGWFCYGTAIKWTVSGHSETVGGKTTVYPGETVYFDHYVKNNGPSSASGVWYDVMQQTDGGTVTTHQAGSALTPLSNGEDRNVLTNDPYTPTQADIGKKYCRRVGVQPESSSSGAYADGSWACVNIRSDYSLYPSVTLSGGGTSGIVVAGGTAGQQSSVENTSAQADVNANYQSYDFAVQAGKSINLGDVFKDQGNGRVFALQGGGGDVCAWLAAQYPAGTVTCKGQVANGSTIFNSGTSTVDQSTINAAGFKTGDLICRMLWVDHYDYNHTASDERRVSLPACVRVAKTPYVQFWGGDVRVGDTIGGATSSQASVYTSSNVINGKNFGSWAEYGIFAPTNGVIQSASAGALSGKNGFVGQASDADKSHLTFANTDPSKGNWSAPVTITSYENSLGLPDGGATSAGSISLDSFASRGKVTLTNGSGTVHVGGTLPKTTPASSLMLFYPTGTVVIDSNVLLGANSYSSLADLSQIVIQAKNIIVTHGVDRVDAWLVAIAQNGTDGGVVSTCDTIATPYYSGLSAKADNPCNQKPLRINGPVMGREVQLRRTFGADADNTPAETIDLRADAYLWTLQSANDGSIDTIFTTELPPRF